MQGAMFCFAGNKFFHQYKRPWNQAVVETDIPVNSYIQLIVFGAVERIWKGNCTSASPLLLLFVGDNC